MNLSPLQLDSFHLIHLQIDTNEEYKNSREEPGNYVVGTDFEILKAPGRLIFKIPFMIRLTGDNPCCRIKKIEVHLEGIFSLPDGLPEKEVRRLVPYNCIAILYGLARGLVSNSTGTIRGGAVLLPTLDFVSIINDKSKRMEAGTTKTITPKNPRKMKRYASIRKRPPE